MEQPNSYRKQRNTLLQACAWNRLVATRGLNADAGREKLKATQSALAFLRMQAQAGEVPRG